jgi:GGDEF domain-containing protein
MSFASASSSHLRRVPAGTGASPGAGRTAIVGHVDRWFASPPAAIGARAALLILDVDLDDALPTSEAEEESRRGRLGRSVQRALGAQVRDGDAVARIDSGRFAVLRDGLLAGCTARTEAADLARRVEEALVGTAEGYGARVTAGGATLVSGFPTAGQELLGRVTGAMLAGKLLTDDRVVVVAAGA